MVDEALRTIQATPMDYEGGMVMTNSEYQEPSQEEPWNNNLTGCGSVSIERIKRRWSLRYILRSVLYPPMLYFDEWRLPPAGSFANFEASLGRRNARFARFKRRWALRKN